MGPCNHHVSLTEPKHHVINSTNPRRALDDGIEHRLHVRRRAADDTEHLGGCSLMLQGLAQFRVAFLELFEQPYIFDSDDSLVCKSLEESNLLFGERIHDNAADDNSTDRDIFAQKRQCKHSSYALPTIIRSTFRKFSIRDR